MNNDFLQVIVPAFIGAASGYLINQLPPLRMFRGSKFLLFAVVIELALLSAIWAWLSGDVGKTATARGVVEKIGVALLGAFFVHIVQIIIGNLQSGQSAINSNSRTVVKKTRMKGKGNKAKVTKGDVWVEDTSIDGENQEFSVTDDANSSSQQNNNPNP